MGVHYLAGEEGIGQSASSISKRPTRIGVGAKWLHCGCHEGNLGLSQAGGLTGARLPVLLWIPCISPGFTVHVGHGRASIVLQDILTQRP